MSPLVSDGLSLQMKAKGTLHDYLFSQKALILLSSRHAGLEHTEGGTGT